MGLRREGIRYEVRLFLKMDVNIMILARKFTDAIRRIEFKVVLPVVALLVSVSALFVSVSALFVSVSNRSDSTAISKVGVRLGKINGLVSYGNEIEERFKKNSNYLIARVVKLKGKRFAIDNRGKLRFVLFYQTLIKLVNSNREVFFKRNELVAEYVALMNVISIDDLVTFSRFIYSSDFENIDAHDLDLLSGFGGSTDISAAINNIDRLQDKVFYQIDKLNKDLESSYMTMLGNGTIDSSFARSYYENSKNEFGYVQSQLDLWKAMGASKSSRTNEIIRSYFDRKIDSFDLELLFNK